MGLYCGIDLHSNNAVYAVADEQDKLVFRKRLPNDLNMALCALEPFREELEAVVVESTYNWYWLVDGLQDHGYSVRLANPAAMEQYNGLKNANDNTDAMFLAHLCRLGILPEGYVYPREERSVRDLLRRRMLLVQERTRMILSLRNMFARENGVSPSWRRIVRMAPEELEQLTGPDPYLRFVAKQQSDVITFLCKKIALFEAKALECVELRPEYELLLTMPGIGMVLGLTVMLETGDINRFAEVGNYTSYCRCVRAQHFSNGKKKGDGNRKNGNKYLSWAFVEAVHHAIRYCPTAKKWYQRKKEHRNGALATKALASKWSKAAYFIMKLQQPFDIRRVFG